MSCTRDSLFIKMSSKYPMVKSQSINIAYIICWNMTGAILLQMAFVLTQSMGACWLLLNVCNLLSEFKKYVSESFNFKKLFLPFSKYFLGWEWVKSRLLRLRSVCTDDFFLRNASQSAWSIYSFNYIQIFNLSSSLLNWSTAASCTFLFALVLYNNLNLP